MVVSLSQNMLSPAHYEDGMENVKNQGNTVKKAEGNGSAQKSTRKKRKKPQRPTKQKQEYHRATELI